MDLQALFIPIKECKAGNEFSENPCLFLCTRCIVV